jgi:hypothetical protein
MIKKSLANPNITFKDALIDVQPRTITVTFAHVGLLAIGIVLGIVLDTGIKACHKPPTPLRDCSGCHNKFTSYFQKNGSRTPEVMAYAILQTRSPRLLASIAVVESGGNSHIRNTGYKKRYHGSFQVDPKIWGTVPHDAVGQALQAERILEELVGEKGTILAALNSYGGDTRGKYARTILRELQEVP